MEKPCILIHYHEIAIKGGNRDWFEKIFVRNVRKQLTGLPCSKVVSANGRVFVFDIDRARWDEYAQRMKCIMGLVNATLMSQITADLDLMKAEAKKLLPADGFETFRVSARRQYKNYPLTSNQVNMEVGGFIQEICQKPVKLKNPDLDIIIEIVKDMAYVGVEKIKGYGGLPVGVGEKAVSLLSSGIDSPVSSFEMLKRGVNLVYIHFHSAPVTSRQSVKNVKEILEVLAGYQSKCQLYSVPLLEIQQKIMAEAPNKYWVILFRRAMVRLADQLAEKIDAPALITGENIGQVASQTLSNIRAIGDAADRPIIRPLAGDNKEDIMKRAAQIGTYEISIEPYQDCCSFFVPPHPETRADLEQVRKIEADIDFGDLYEQALEQAEITMVEPQYMKA
ncbi:MAG: tRNA 4-thiouridine(8) synthase ThiI [FCB group bacterium]|nr:tRNA 4-thiouridine(8) synthase ThiI [FCB group bacterium]